jgi:hypothetical protein
MGINVRLRNHCYLASVVLFFGLNGQAQSADITALKNCALRAFNNVSGINVVAARQYSTDIAEIVLNDGARDLVSRSERSGGALYDELVQYLYIAKMCWVEKDRSAIGVRVDVVERNGSLVIKDR